LLFFLLDFDPKRVFREMGKIAASGTNMEQLGRIASMNWDQRGKTFEKEFAEKRDESQFL